MFNREKKGGDGKENRVRIIEGLISFIWEVVDMYHQGVGPGAHEPMSPALAKSMIADEINRQLGEPLLEGEWKHARLRISGSDLTHILGVLQILTVDRVVTLRWVGARDREDDAVVYATVKCSQVSELTHLVLALEKEGLEVRDGTFGLFVR